MIQPLKTVVDDGLLITDIRPHSEQKYERIKYLAEMFASGMKDKWECRVYLDLFSGCGYSRVEGTDRILQNSSLLAMDIAFPFDRYIFCEKDNKKIEALRTRVARGLARAEVKFVTGDSNKTVTEIKSFVPKGSKEYKVLTLCLIDPFRLQDIKFATIEALAQIIIDFVVIIPSYMDANRNQTKYCEPGDNTIDEFLGSSEWRVEWQKVRSKSREFGNFLVSKFDAQMVKLGFHSSKDEGMHLVQLGDKHVKLYHIACYSRNKLGMEFWKRTLKGSAKQLDLF
jgi:three-Cys-motif partner protein